MTDEGEEGWSIGLGYGASKVAAAERDTQRSSDVLLQRYMQQCLAYHHEQQQQQQQQRCETTTRKSAVVERVEEEETTGQRLTFEGRLTEHQEAMIDNARAIAQRLSTTTTSSMTTSNNPSNNDYAMKRAKHAERHNQRLRRALVSNLEYLANKDLAQQHHQQQIQQQQQLQQQQIQKKKMGEEEGNRSLYISGFTSESDEETITRLFAMYGPIQTCIFYKDKTTGRNKGDALIVYSSSILPQQQQQHLFKKDFLQHICHQLNGAELPCHCILNVQPATPTKKTKKQHDNTTTNNNNDTIVGMEKNNMVVEKQQQQHSFKSDISATDLKEEDLDDFFASLE